MLESDHEVEDEQAPTQQEEVDKVAEGVAATTLDPLEATAGGGGGGEGGEGGEGGDAVSPKSSLKDRASKAVTEVTSSAKKGAAKAAQVSRETYEKVKVKTAEYRKELGARTKKVAAATTEAALDAVGKALTAAENTKTYFKSVLSKEALQQMRKNAMEKYPQYFTGAADKNREAFQDFLAQGAEPVLIEHGRQMQIPFRVKNGDVVRWNFRVLNDDVEFSVAIRKMQVGGAVEENVRQPQKFAAGTNHHGSYSFVYSAGQVVVSWSNAYSWFKDKHVAYIAEVVSAEDAAKIETAGLADNAVATAAPVAEEGEGGGAAAASAAPASAAASTASPAEPAAADAAEPAVAGGEGDDAPAPVPVVMQEGGVEGSQDGAQQLPAVASDGATAVVD